MAQRESRLSKRIADVLREAYGFDLFIFKVWGSDHMMAGLPDLVGCVQGLFFGLEVKHPETRENVSPRQEFVHTQIRNAGGICAVVTTPSEALEVLDDALKARDMRPHK